MLSACSLSIDQLSQQLQKCRISQNSFKIRLQTLISFRSKITTQLQTLTKDYQRKIKNLQQKINKITQENNQLKKINIVYQSEIQNFQKRLLQKEKLIVKVFMRDSQAINKLPNTIISTSNKIINIEQTNHQQQQIQRQQIKNIIVSQNSTTKINKKQKDSNIQRSLKQQYNQNNNKNQQIHIDIFKQNRENNYLNDIQSANQNIDDQNQHNDNDNNQVQKQQKHQQKKTYKSPPPVQGRGVLRVPVHKKKRNNFPSIPSNIKYQQQAQNINKKQMNQSKFNHQQTQMNKHNESNKSHQLQQSDQYNLSLKIQQHKQVDQSDLNVNNKDNNNINISKDNINKSKDNINKSNDHINANKSNSHISQTKIKSNKSKQWIQNIQTNNNQKQFKSPFYDDQQVKTYQNQLSQNNKNQQVSRNQQNQKRQSNFEHVTDNQFQNVPKPIKKHPAPPLKKLIKAPLPHVNNNIQKRIQPSKTVKKYPSPVNFSNFNYKPQEQFQNEQNKNTHNEQNKQRQRKDSNQGILNGLVDSQEYHNNNNMNNMNNMISSENQYNNNQQDLHNQDAHQIQNTNQLNPIQQPKKINQNIQNISHASYKSKRNKRQKPMLINQNDYQDQNLINFPQSQIKRHVFNQFKQQEYFDNKNYNQQIKQINNNYNEQQQQQHQNNYEEYENQKKALDFFNDLSQNNQNNINKIRSYQQHQHQQQSHQGFYDQSSIQQIQDHSMISNPIFPEDNHEDNYHQINKNQHNLHSYTTNNQLNVSNESQNINKKMIKKKAKRDNVKVLDPKSFE